MFEKYTSGFINRSLYAVDEAVLMNKDRSSSYFMKMIKVIRIVFIPKIDTSSVAHSSCFSRINRELVKVFICSLH